MCLRPENYRIVDDDIEMKYFGSHSFIFSLTNHHLAQTLGTRKLKFCTDFFKILPYTMQTMGKDEYLETSIALFEQNRGVN